MVAMPADWFLRFSAFASMACCIEIVQEIYTIKRLIVQARYIVRRLKRVTSRDAMTPHTRLQQEFPRLIFCLKVDSV